MKKGVLLAIISIFITVTLIAAYLLLASPSSTTATPTAIANIELEATLEQASTPTPTRDVTLAPESTPEPMEKYPLIVPAPIYSDMLTIHEDGVSEVTIGYRIRHVDHIKNIVNGPAYLWHINPNINNGIKHVVIEFDLLETADPKDESLIGYNRGFFVGLKNMTEIHTGIGDYWSLWNAEGEYPERFKLDTEAYLQYPFLSIDMTRYAKVDDKKCIIRIPYNQFLGGARSLNLQFLPGAKYANIEIYLEGYNIEDISLEQLSDTRDIENLGSVSPYIDDNLEGNFKSGGYEGIANVSIHNDNQLKELFYNIDGSVNMLMTDFDLGEYADEVTCTRGIIPEGLITVLTRSDEDIRKYNARGIGLVNFVYENMRDQKTGLVSGIWDNENSIKLVPERRTANFPLLLKTIDLLSHEQIYEWFQAIIEHEVVIINTQAYYLPNGVDEDGITIIELEDLVCAGILGNLEYLYKNYDQYEIGEISLVLEAITNSTELMLRAQELNPTHLPTNSIKVVFNEDGSIYLEPIGEEFYINNNFYLNSLGRGLGTMGFFSNSINTALTHLDQTEDDNEIEMIKYVESDLKLFRNISGLFLYQIKILQHVYDFIKVQDKDIIFAPGYNVNTGEPIFYDSLPTSANIELYKRFGNPKEYYSYFLVLSAFLDIPLMLEVQMLNTEFSLNMVKYMKIENRLTSDEICQMFVKCNINYTKDIFFQRFFYYFGIDHHYIPIEVRAFGWRMNIYEYLQEMVWKNGINITPAQIEYLETLTDEPIFPSRIEWYE